MDIKPNFKFEVSLSRDCYKKKPDAVDYRRMSWRRVNISLSDFINHITTGYSYCHIYYNDRRAKNKFLYTHVISIDVDDTETDLLTFIAGTTLKPTFAYETFSNGADGKYSYRLVFVFKEKLNKDQFVEMYDKLCRMTNLTETKDHCGKVLTQLMNGTNKQAYVYRSNNIYSMVEDLPIESMNKPECSTSLFDTVSVMNPKPSSKSYINKPIINNISSKIKKQYKPEEPFWKEVMTNYKEPIDMLMKDRQMFLDFYHQIFKVTRWSKLQYNEYGYCVIPEDHLSLFVRYRRKRGECVINRFRDGEKRRNRLFTDGCIIRKIKPDITFLELLYNLVHRV